MYLRALTISCLAVSLLRPIALGFQKSANQQAANKLRNELQSPFKKWLDDDVAYIISDEERQAWTRLATDDEREQFIEQFWLRRDPTPETGENEFREEHYRRIAYANQHYASGIAGSKTDRGRMYIIHGPPGEIEDHTAGGAYQRPPEQGGGTTTVYPFQQWRYRYLEGIGTNVILEFVDPTMTGEFHMTMDPFEKEALRHTANGLTPQEQPGAQFRRLEQYVQAQRPPVVRFPDLEAQVDSAITFNILPLQVFTEYFPLTESSVRANITIQLANKDLQFAGGSGGQKAVVNLYGRITTISRRVVAVFEDSVTVNAPPGLLAETGARSSVYRKSIPLPPGMYRLNVVVRDAVGGNRGNREVALSVPRL